MHQRRQGGAVDLEVTVTRGGNRIQVILDTLMAREQAASGVGLRLYFRVGRASDRTVFFRSVGLTRTLTHGAQCPAKPKTHTHTKPVDVRLAEKAIHVNVLCCVLYRYAET